MTGNLTCRNALWEDLCTFSGCLWEWICTYFIQCFNVQNAVTTMYIVCRYSFFFFLSRPQYSERQYLFCYIFADTTHPDSFDQLHRSHITQYRCGYCKPQYHKGTMRVLWHYCDRRLRSYCTHSSCKVPSMALPLAVTTAVLPNIRRKKPVKGNLAMYNFT